MSALRRVLPAAVAFVVVGGRVYRKKQHRRRALVARGGACGRPGWWSGGLGRRPLVAVTPKPGDSVRISAVAGGVTPSLVQKIAPARTVGARLRERERAGTPGAHAGRGGVQEKRRAAGSGPAARRCSFQSSPPPPASASGSASRPALRASACNSWMRVFAMSATFATVRRSSRPNEGERSQFVRAGKGG